jgi:3-hydroxymyristoyl/3-hydroxydecanoyl-(acyl carrier protein) dehydratase
MNEIELNHQQLADYLPHRGPNLIPDTVWLAEDLLSSRSVTHIREGDTREREWFYRSDASGKRFWNEPFLGELIALTGVPMLTESLNKEGKVAVFSAISKAKAPIPAEFYAEIIGEAKITRARSGFAQFEAHLKINGEIVYQAEVMSGSASMADIMGGERSSQEPIANGEAFTAFPWKPTEMTFIDRIISQDDGSIQAGYHYSENHPFIPGHFPDGPLMMGVTQWIAIGDALAVLCQAKGLGDGSYVGQGGITRQDGSEVVNGRDIAFEIVDGHPRLIGLRRIIFRDVVRPGDELLINASIET